MVIFCESVCLPMHQSSILKSVLQGVYFTSWQSVILPQGRVGRPGWLFFESITTAAQSKLQLDLVAVRKEEETEVWHQSGGLLLLAQDTCEFWHCP